MTRARSFPSDAAYTLEVATSLLEDRLQEIAEADDNVSTDERVAQSKSCISSPIRTPTPSVLQSAYAALDAQTKGNTIQ